MSTLEECKNGKCCVKKPAFKAVKIGRILRNIFSNFEFANKDEEDGEPIKYEKKCKKLVGDFKNNYKFKCDIEDC